MTAREFLSFCGISISEDTLSILTEYLHNSEYDMGIDYAQFPDAEIGGLEEDPDEPARFQEYLERHSF